MENKQLKLLDLYALQKDCDAFQYLYSTILYHAAPVINNDKPAVLLSFATSQRNLKAQWDQYRAQFPMTGPLKFYEIRRTPNFVCILFYHEDKLADWFKRPDVHDFLISKQYPDSIKLSDILSDLRRRSRDTCPHEIGIFIGYPPEDIEGFIKHEGKNCLHCGYWKVYANAEEKKAKFHAYDRARMNMIQEMMNGDDTPFVILHKCQFNSPLSLS